MLREIAERLCWSLAKYTDEESATGTSLTADVGPISFDPEGTEVAGSGDEGVEGASSVVGSSPIADVEPISFDSEGTAVTGSGDEGVEGAAAVAGSRSEVGILANNGEGTVAELLITGLIGAGGSVDVGFGDCRTSGREAG